MITDGHSGTRSTNFFCGSPRDDAYKLSSVSHKNSKFAIKSFTEFDRVDFSKDRETSSVICHLLSADNLP